MMKHSRMSQSIATALMAAALATPAVAAPAPAAPPAIGAAPLTLLMRYPANTKGRDFVCGDLHGCRAMFDALLIRMGFDKEVDRMFCTGDLGDRGPDSLGCYALLDEPWFHSVAGNHEEMLLRAATEPNFDWQWWVANGGLWATKLEKAQLLELADKVSNMPLAIVVGDGAGRFNVIHGEFYGPDEALEDVLENIDTQSPVPLSLTWGRDMAEGKVDPACQEGLSLTFSGHTVVENVSRMGNQIYIDTGAYKAERRGDHSTYALTAIEPKTATVWRSQAAVELQ